jgi:hypothetical protein
MRTPEKRVLGIGGPDLATIESFLTCGLLFMVASRTQPQSVGFEDIGGVATVVGLSLLLIVDN